MGSVERAYVAIDVNNLWHSCREIYGRDTRVSYPSLKRLINGRRYSNLPRQLTITAYTVTLSFSKTDNARFLQSLQKLGFIVKTRSMRIEKGLAKPFATDWDVGITIDAISDVNTYDTFILVSGDGDYAMLLERLHKLGKRVEVITFQTTASSLLHAVADELVYLTENEVFQDPGRRHGSSDQEDPAPEED